MDPRISHINIQLKGKHNRNILVDVIAPADYQQHPVIIFSHGFKGFKDWGPFNQVAQAFAEAGFIYVKFNFAFNGTTPEQLVDFADLEAFGNNNFTRELDDLEQVVDWVYTQPLGLKFDTSRISLLGHSRGGGIVILKAAEDERITAVATWAAVSDFSRFITSQDIAAWKKTGVHYVENTRTGQQMPLYIQLYHDYINNLQRLQIKNAAGRLNVPLLLVHGTNDDTVSFEQAVELYEQNRTRAILLEIPGGDHTFGASHPHIHDKVPLTMQKVIRETVAFFNNVHA